MKNTFGSSLVVAAAVAVGCVPLHAAEKAVDKGAVSSSQAVAFNVYVPLQNRAALNADLTAMHDSSSPRYQKWLTAAQFDAKYAPVTQLAAVQKQLAGYGLTVTATSSNRLHVTGSASMVEYALTTKLHNGQFANGQSTVMAATPISVTGAMASAGAMVSGLSGRIRMKQHAMRAAVPANRYSAVGAYWFDDLKEAYTYPSYGVLDGKGTTIGVLMSGAYNPSDMDAYFSHEKLATPNISTVVIDGGLPFSLDNSFETHLDIQQSGGMAPKANIILYELPDLSDDSIIDGLTKIVKDNKADVVNMSFGGAEIFYTADFNDGTDYTYLIQEEDDLFARGNAQGITFVASSGDSGAFPAFPVGCFDGGPNCGQVIAGVEFPASSPHVTGVGGTNLVTTYTAGSLDSKYVRESAFYDPVGSDIFYGTSATGTVWGSGGGDSIIFTKPLFQALTNTGNAKFRTVPDLAGHMGGCPVGATSCGADDSSDIDTITGLNYGVIGTSASAPDFAGLTALAVQRYGTRLGNENYYIYALAALQKLLPGIKAFKQGIPGNNGLYSTTTTGYNRVLGNGTVSGRDYLLAPLVPAAGTPQTPTNP